MPNRQKVITLHKPVIAFAAALLVPGCSDSGTDPRVRHEEAAAFMACGHAKFTGEVGVCLATSGPGAIHLLNGPYDAAVRHRADGPPRHRALRLPHEELRCAADETQDIPDFPHAGFAEMVGLKGIRVDRADRVGADWDEALSADRPVVIDAVTDPNVPTLPY